MTTAPAVIPSRTTGLRPDAVSIVIPALDEAAAIGDVVRGLRERFADTEIIVVDDGSTDETAAIAEEAGARVLNHDKCYGYGAALRTGAESGRGGSTCSSVTPTASTRRKTSGGSWTRGTDMTWSWGRRGPESHLPLLRRPGKALLGRFAEFLAGEKIPDLNSGLRLVRRDVLLRYIHLMPRGFSFTTTSTFAFIKTHRRIEWVPITTARRVGISTVVQWKHGPEVLLLVLRLTVLFEPLKVFLAVSGVLCVLSLISFAVDLILSGGKGIGDTTVMLSVATVLVFLFGLLCDQVSALRREIHE